MPLIIETFAVGMLGCNCTVVADPDTRQALVVDPGDAAHTGAEILLHRGDRWLYDNLALQARFFGLPASAAPPPAPPPTRELEGDEVLAFGQREARVLHTPGHTPGSICFFVERVGETPVLFAGDTLFRQSIGRTDLWGGSFDQIIVSIRQRLFSLPEQTLVIPGHGPSTTIGAEREGNPFVGARARRSSDSGSHA